MGAKSEVEMLQAHAQFMRESLRKSQSVTETMITILSSFNKNLSSLETTIQPTQIQTHAFRKAHENIDNTLKVVESILTQFDGQVEKKLLSGSNNDLGGFLVAMDQLQYNVKFFTKYCSLKASDGPLNHGQNLLSKGMNRLADLFKALLIQHSKLVDPSQLQQMIPNFGKHSGNPSIEGRPNDSNRNAKVTLELPVLVSPIVVLQLREMTQRLVDAGYHTQCIKIYRDVRTSTLEQILRKLGVEKLSKKDVQKMRWEVIELKISNWIQYMQISVKLLFAGERKLCDQIWYHLDPHREKCFVDVIDSSMHMLLNFGEAIARSKKTPEKLFVFLDMHETLQDLLPEIEIVFSSTPATSIRQAIYGLIHHVSQTATNIFSNVENVVSIDTTKIHVLDGTVHPLTSSVINYIKVLFDYQKTLSHLLEGEQPIKTPTPLATTTMRIMSLLQTNLDAKSKLYKDHALSQLFLMNNIHYIISYVRKSEAKFLLGDDWIQKQQKIVQQYTNTYQRVAWKKALSYLSMSTSSIGQLSSGPLDHGNGISKFTIKDRCKNFNLLFEEMYNRQIQWTIPDIELKKAIQLAVADILIPSYRSFIKQYSAIIESEKSKEKYIKYTPEDLEQMLGKLFEGKSCAESSW